MKLGKLLWALDVWPCLIKFCRRSSYGFNRAWCLWTALGLLELINAWKSCLQCQKCQYWWFSSWRLGLENFQGVSLLLNEDIYSLSWCSKAMWFSLCVTQTNTIILQNIQSALFHNIELYKNLLQKKVVPYYNLRANEDNAERKWIFR